MIAINNTMKQLVFTEVEQRKIATEIENAFCEIDQDFSCSYSMEKMKKRFPLMCELLMVMRCK